MWSWSCGSWIYDYQCNLVLITTNVVLVSSNLVHGQVYPMQHYVRKFVSDLKQVDGFLLVTPFPSSTNIVVSGVQHHNSNPRMHRKDTIVSVHPLNHTTYIPPVICQVHKKSSETVIKRIYTKGPRSRSLKKPKRYKFTTQNKTM